MLHFLVTGRELSCSIITSTHFVKKLSIILCLPIPVATQSKALVVASLLRLWVRIPQGAWTYVCCESCVCDVR